MNGEGLECATYCITESKAWLTEQLSHEWSTIDWTLVAPLLTERLHNGYRTVCATKPFFWGPRFVDAQGIVRDLHGMAIHSGSTFSMAIVFPWEAGFRTVVIQVGDSDVFVNGACVECDHTPLSQSEFMRIQSFPAETRLQLTYHMKQSPLVFLPSGEYDPRFYNVKWAQPWRWNSGITPTNAKYQPGSYAKSPASARDLVQIGMTRAIGDFYAHPCGMTHVPHVTILDHPTRPSVFMASDGAWDTIDVNHQWVGTKGTLGGVDLTPRYETIQQQGQSTEFLVEQLVEELYELSREKFGDQIDDISVAVLL